MTSAMLKMRANNRYLAEARQVRARLVARLRSMEMMAERSEACATLAAVYRTRLEDLDSAIRGLSPPGEDMGAGQAAAAPGQRRVRTRPRRRKSSGVLPG